MKQKIVSGRIGVIGPESSGKTTLAKALANKWRAIFIPEYARTFLDKSDGAYKESDLVLIARRQFEMINAIPDSSLSIVDTELIVIKIWSDVKFGRVDPWITEHIPRQFVDFYLLCSPDLRWEADPLREHPGQDDRWKLFDYYRRELEEWSAVYRIIRGHDFDSRLKDANAAVLQLIA